MIETGEFVEMKFTELLKCNASMNDSDKKNIRKAFDYANYIFRNDKLPNGTPYILHNINVAITALKEIGLGPTSAICALLHGDRIKSEFELKNIKAEFGDQVAEIVEGFNKISELRTERISYQSDAFRTLFLSMVNDMRVILIRLAHRLNDIRNLDLLGERIEPFIDEIKHLYTPIAHRLGLYHVKTEFEERVMRYENPILYDSITQKIRATKATREAFIKEFIKPIELQLNEKRIQYNIKWRMKSVPSIVHKMNKLNVDFEGVYDLFAVRITIKSKAKKEKELCWRVYSIVTDLYQPNPERLRDWITMPKPNGYESLHTTVQGKNNRWFEVQIRTTRMDDVAEKGHAAHWQYKDSMGKSGYEDWLSEVRELIDSPKKNLQASHYRSSRTETQESIFVFTPKGDLKKLPAKSTILDFAYEIHTDVGSKCRGATVNNKAVPIRYVLNNGDKVDILTSKNQKPKLDWLAFVKTEKARVNIKKKLNEEKYREAEIGKEIFTRKLKNWKIKSSEDLVNILVKAYKLDTGTDLYYLIAEEKIDVADIKKRLLDFIESETARKKPEIQEAKRETKAETVEHEEIVYIGENLKNVNYRLAKCCSPIQGDRVFGFVTATGGLTIHRKSCPNAKSLTTKYPYRVMQIKWVHGDLKSYSTTNLKITGTDELGLVSAVTRTITDDLRVNMRSINFQKKGKHFEGRVSVLVKDYDHLDQLIAKLNQVKGVEKVVRVK